MFKAFYYTQFSIILHGKSQTVLIILREECISKSKKIVGHISFNWSKLASMFLKVPNSCIRGTVTRKRGNRSAGLELEIPMDYTFYGDARVALWLKKHSRK